MTDNENVMAVKSCKTIEDELSLIDRLKGERDCYKNELKYANNEKEALNKLCGEQKAEIERLQNENFELRTEVNRQHSYCEYYVNTIGKAKAEAIKEFAERYEKIKTDRVICSYCHFKDGIDNLVKEMVGDDK